MYRCRSAWKLLELDDTYHLFSRGCSTVVDLAAAPGGFAQVALQRMAAASAKKPSPVVVAFDQRPIVAMEGLFAVKCDINDHVRVMNHTASLLRKLQSNNEQMRRSVQVVLHDGVSVVKAQSAFSVTYGQNQMALGALRLSCSLFSSQRKGTGTQCPTDTTSTNDSMTFVTKAMHSTHFNTLLEAVKRYYSCVNVHRPSECKTESLETYIVARGFMPQRWILEERRAAGSHPHLSVPPHREDVLSGRQVLWRCWGCRAVRLGAAPCPLCSVALFSR
ncbi:putative FtsJ cell division protein [Trypanosoma grayi]|uniref:putative FtsJ cell division protein n=1 Tax=Trypanosoma grayi TaxID=71804 RepID=UPI0004F431B5|nr:putative FtsJ cell division protein [Trypanosoma grayi]KEG10071.1 putative FtsJ cell division protein [Trypanosoma grayi]